MTKYFTVVCLFLVINLNAQSTATLNIKLGVENGKIVVDSSNLVATLTYPNDAEKQLVQLINTSFSTLDSLIRNDSTQWCAKDGICYGFDEFKEDYLVFTQNEGTGEAVTFSYLDMVDKGEAELPLLGLFTENLFYIIQQVVFVDSPIDLTMEEFEEEAYELMHFYFAVKSPINVAKTAVIWLDKDTIKTKAKNRVLKGLDGQLFFNDRISQRLSEYYGGLNFQPSFFLEPTQFRILPPKISRFQVVTDKEEEVDKIAYLLLPHPLYQAFLKLPKDSIQFTGLSGKTIYQFDLLPYFNREVGQLPILPSNSLRQIQAQLFQQGYNLNTSQTPNAPLDGLVPVAEQSLYVDLIVTEMNQDADSTNIEPSTPDLVTDNELTAEVNEGDFNSTDELKQKRTLTQFKRNFIGIGADFFLNDETRLKAVFQRLLKDGSNLSVELGYAFNEAGFREGGLVVSGNFSKDYLFFNTLKKRLGLQISAGTNFSANRVFANESFKERRTGGQVRMDIDWFRNQNNRLFQSSLRVKEERVVIENFAAIESFNTNLLTTQWGNIFFITSPVKLFTTRLKLENNLNLGWTTLTETSPTTFFATGLLQANLNQKIVKGMAFDFTLYHQWATVNTPIFEQIGHQVSRNRGFREDAVIGRNLWGGTLEFWTPFPRFGDKNSKVNQYFYQHLRLAIFNDFSQYNQLANFEETVALWSPGLGIRLLMGIAQVNFDWAFRRTPIDTLNGGGQFSLNLVLNSPFQ